MIPQRPPRDSVFSTVVAFVSSSSRALRCAALVASLLPALLAAQTTTPYNWKSVKIGGAGFVTGVVFSEAQQNLVYARTDVGGLYRSTDTSSALVNGHSNYTTTWTCLSDFNGPDDYDLYGVLSVATDKNDANRVYALCGEYIQSWAPNGTLFTSTNKGTNWTRVDLPFKVGGNENGRLSGERLAVDPSNGAILYCGSNTTAGLWKSTNHGATWTQVSTFPTAANLSFVVFDPKTNYGGPGTETKAVYVGVNTASGNTLYRTNDGGATWANFNPTGLAAGMIPQHLAIDSKSGAAGVLYVTYGNAPGPSSITSGALYKRDISTGTWTLLHPPADTNSTGSFGYCALAVDTVNAGGVWVATIDRWTDKDEIYRSTNGGSTWSAGLIGDANATFNYTSAPYLTNFNPHWIGALSVDPFAGGHAMFGTGYGLFETQLSGAWWAISVNGIEEAVPMGLASPSSGAPLVSVIRDFDGFYHSNLTTSPTRLTPTWGNSFSLDFAEATPAIMVRTHGGGGATSNDPYGARTTDGGQTWTDFANSPAETRTLGQGKIAVSANGTNLVWAPDKTTPYRSTNAGATAWTKCNWWVTSTANASFTPVSDRVDSTKFYIYDSAAGKVYCSTDGGSGFWQGATGLPTGGKLLRAVPGKAGDLWLPTGSGLYRSQNSGINFSPVSGVTSAAAIGFGKSATTGGYPAIYLAGTINGVYGLYRSTDTGANWTRINDAAHQFGYFALITGDPRTFGRIYLATGGRGIIYGDPQ